MGLWPLVSEELSLTNNLVNGSGSRFSNGTAAIGSPAELVDILKILHETTSAKHTQLSYSEMPDLQKLWEIINISCFSFLITNRALQN